VSQFVRNSLDEAVDESENVAIGGNVDQGSQTAVSRYINVMYTGVT
jgi:hypothetical protein